MNIRQNSIGGWQIAKASAVSAGMLAALAVPSFADIPLPDLVERVSPSVVTVLARQDETQDPDRSDANRAQRPNGTPFEEFFERFGHGRGLPEGFSGKTPRAGLGSGFILDPEGWIVTNHHVVEGADRVTIRLSDDREYEADIIGTDPSTDIALLRIEADDALPYVSLGNSDEIRVGEDVMAVGNPFGLGGTVTSGIVSAKGRNISAGPYAEFLQTDAAINKGNSGGPLFDMDGNVVGVNSAIYSPTGGSVGVGFAVTSNIVERVVEDLMEDGQVDRGWLGVSIQDITPALAGALGLDAVGGALVSQVVDGSPSDGQLQAGDVILEFNAEPVPDSRALPRLVGATPQGEEVEILVQRDGAQTLVSVQIGALQTAEADLPQTAAEEKDASLDTFGATVGKLTDATRARAGLEDDTAGVVITSLSNAGPAADAGLRVGDVILRLGDVETGDPAALRDAFASQSTDPALLLISRAGRQIFVAVDMA